MATIFVCRDHALDKLIGANNIYVPLRVQSNLNGSVAIGWIGVHYVGGIATITRRLSDHRGFLRITVVLELYSDW